jgi:AcrR family transcriptional regulator
VRERALEVAAAQLETQRWDQLRIGHIATEVGVSRPTIYAEFGSKDGLGEELVLFEARRFLAGIDEALQKYADLPVKAVERAVTYTLTQGRRSAVIRAIVSGEVAGESNPGSSLLPFATTRSESLMATANDALTEWFSLQCSTTSAQDVADAVDTLIRVVVSYMLSNDSKTRVVAARAGRIAAKMLPELGEPSVAN